MKTGRFIFTDSKLKATISNNDFSKLVSQARKKFGIRLRTDEEVIFNLRRELKAYKKFYEERLTPQEIEYLKNLKKRLGFK